MPINLFVIVFFVGGWIVNKIFMRAHLPGILGMVFFGICLKLVFPSAIPAGIWDIEPFLKSLALVVILLRAGLGIRRKTLQKVGKTAVLMSFIPCLVEAAGLTVAFRFLFGFQWMISALFAFVLSAVSPAVVVPSMLDLKNKGWGSKNDVPTMILASASADDVIAITFFSLFLGIVTGSGEGLGKAIIAIPFSILSGVAAGVLIGFFLSGYFRRKYHKIRATEKTLLLLMVGLFVVEIGNAFHIAAFLGVMTIGLILLERAEHIAHEIAQKLSKIWVVAEIVLFVLIGMAVDPKLALETGVKGVFVIMIGLVFRSLGVFFATAFDPGLSAKERVFCVLAFLPKATVQAALGSIPLAAGIKGGGVILSMAVLGILLTAPLGVFLINRYGPVLLDN
jgi:NhaP-type Na+/H+ or K+/H+ antiporter